MPKAFVDPDENKPQKNSESTTNNKSSRCPVRKRNQGSQTGKGTDKDARIENDPSIDEPECILCQIRPAVAGFVCCCSRRILCFICESRLSRCPLCGLRFDERTPL